MIKLYGVGFSNNVNKVRYVLNQLGLSYDWEQTNPMQGETKTPAFQAITPTGKIPAIEIDGLKLFESNAIVRYLAVIKNSSLYPADPAKRAVIDAWMDYSSIHVQQALGRVMFNRLFAPMMGQKVDEASLQTGLEFLSKYFPIIDAQLAKNAYLAGSELSLADMTLLAVLDPCELCQVSLEQYQNITAWRKKLISQAFYQKCYKDYTAYVQEAMAVKK